MHDGLIVLMYHRVNDKLPKGELVVGPEEFAQQMLFLSANSGFVRVVGINETLQALRGKRGHTGQANTKVLITFDDGYRDNYINALPVLASHGFPAIIFLTTDYISTNVKRPRYANVPWDRDYLDMAEIKEMAGKGIAFGAHTRTHPHLAQIGGEGAKEEIAGSYNAIKGICDVADIAFCYPYGEYNGYIKKLVSEAGFSCAFSTNPGINYKGQDLFEIKRVAVSGAYNLSAFKDMMAATK
ncbi:MAG: polysaccharide deacetylase family protein [Candidatus Omnitrophica bacterium]|nr:polysaccharide deacetylase family protein [Candidatus Omnitrophota bacterium]